MSTKSTSLLKQEAGKKTGNDQTVHCLQSREYLRLEVRCRCASALLIQQAIKIEWSVNQEKLRLNPAYADDAHYISVVMQLI